MGKSDMKLERVIDAWHNEMPIEMWDKIRYAVRAYGSDQGSADQAIGLAPNIVS